MDLAAPTGYTTPLMTCSVSAGIGIGTGHQEGPVPPRAQAHGQDPRCNNCLTPKCTPQDVSVDVPPVRSSRDRAVGRNKRKADSAASRDDDIERQAKLEQALLQQLDMQKKLHEQLEVCRTPSPRCHAASPLHPQLRTSMLFVSAKRQQHMIESFRSNADPPPRASQAQRQLQMRLELHQQHITAMLKVPSRMARLMTA